MSVAVRLFAYGEQFGGAERQIATLCTELIEQNIAVSCYLHFDGLLASTLRDGGVIVHDLANTRLRDLIKEAAAPGQHGELPVMHAHNTRSALLAGLIRLFTRTPVVKTEHGSPSGIGLKPYPRFRASVARLVELAVLRLSGAAVVFVSQDLQHRGSWAGRRHSYVIPNGIRIPDTTPPRPAELTPHRFNVVFAGRLALVKAPLAAVEAMRLLPPSSSAQLIMLGDGPLRMEVEAAASNAALRDRVRLLGFRNDSLNFIAHADAVVVPSLHEGLPFVALEALAFGVPLIASRVGGLREHLTDRQTVLFVEPADPHGIAACIAELEANAELRARLVLEGKVLARERLSSKTMASRYVEIYERLRGDQGQ